MGIDGSFWRAIAVYRIASLVYAAVLLVAAPAATSAPMLGWLVLGVMALWTVATTFAYSDRGVRRLAAARRRPARHRAACSPPRVVAGRAAVRQDGRAGHRDLASGRRCSPGRCTAGGGAGVAAARSWLRDRPVAARPRGFEPGRPLNGTVLLLLAGVVVGHVARLAKKAEERLQRAVELEAASRERERLARDIHDSVLQVLALVQRRGAGAGRRGGRAGPAGRRAGGGAARAGQARRRTARAAGRSPTCATLLAPYALGRRRPSRPRRPPLRLPAPRGRARSPRRSAPRWTTCAGTARRGRPGLGAGRGRGGRGHRDRPRRRAAASPPGGWREAAAEGRLGVAQSIRGPASPTWAARSRSRPAPAQGTEVELRCPGPGQR